MFSEHPQIWAVVPAAGSGIRMNSSLPKQYLPLAGCTVLEHSVERLLELDCVRGIVVVVATDDTRWPSLAFANDERLSFVDGGASRAESVRAGLRHLQERQIEGSPWVLVHDAARPCVDPRNVEALIERCFAVGFGGILAAPVTDTLKRSASSATVAGTENREQFWLAHTPQFFPLEALAKALDKAVADGMAVTDEASAIERAGGQVLLVADDKRNIKITLPSDLSYAEHLLNHREKV